MKIFSFDKIKRETRKFLTNFTSLYSLLSDIPVISFEII